MLCYDRFVEEIEYALHRVDGPDLSQCELEAVYDALVSIIEDVRSDMLEYLRLDLNTRVNEYHRLLRLSKEAENDS